MRSGNACNEKGYGWDELKKTEVGELYVLKENL